MSAELSNELPVDGGSTKSTQAVHGTSDREFIERAYWRVLARRPSEQEQQLCAEFLVEQAKLLSDPAVLTPVTVGEISSVAPADSPRQRARENLVHVLLNHHDFVTIH